MLIYRDGNILDFHNDKQYGKETTIAIPVNTVGVGGAGLALQFKQQNPELFEQYKKKLEHLNRVGLNDPVRPFMLGSSNQFMMFPTKRHWKDKSKLADVQENLKYIRTNKGGLFHNLALPKLGCGFGGLKWLDVEQAIIDTLSDVHYNVFIFGESNFTFTPDPDKSNEQNFVDWLFG